MVAYHHPATADTDLPYVEFNNKLINYRMLTKILPGPPSGI
jgi:hypothetical protein